MRVKSSLTLMCEERQLYNQILDVLDEHLGNIESVAVDAYFHSEEFEEDAAQWAHDNGWTPPA